MSEDGDKPRPTGARRGFLRKAVETTLAAAATVGTAAALIQIGDSSLPRSRWEGASGGKPSSVDLLPKTPEGVILRGQLQNLEGVLGQSPSSWDITAVELTPKEAEIIEPNPSSNQPADLASEGNQLKVVTEKPQPGDHLSWHFEASRFSINYTTKYGNSYRQEVFAAIPEEQPDSSLKWGLHFIGVRTGEIVKDRKTNLRHVTGPFKSADGIRLTSSTPQAASR